MRILKIKLPQPSTKKPAQNEQELLEKQQQELQQTHDALQKDIQNLNEMIAEFQANRQNLISKKVQSAEILQSLKNDYQNYLRTEKDYDNDDSLEKQKNDLQQKITLRRKEFESLQEKLANINELAIPEMEQTLSDARAKLNHVQDEVKQQLRPMQERYTHLNARIETLSALFSHQNTEFVSILDNLQVAEGFEDALGAVLGEDLQASTDKGAPISWRAAFTQNGARYACLRGCVIWVNLSKPRAFCRNAFATNRIGV